MNQLFEIAKLVSELCDKTGDQSLGSRVDAGRLQLVSLIYDERGEAVVTPLSDWTPTDRFIEFLKEKVAGVR